ncbi:FadR/GntR family transcriptional regulator [uncultured Pseudokineococcus sp.]|uniref:FadR/GntR family transcriptional regulator n=1 Tax=uncultured Pseudokineococcus sp. TaxID=1642928 RepID=UPI00263885FF|nr:FadR/GntR family transcriptional regulator [uncultured Pseudokineococcus sp.]
MSVPSPKDQPAGVVRQRRLSDQVSELLRADIVERGLRPGDRLASEREMCERFGVSRTVVREAVQALAAKGIVVASPGSGLAVGTTSLEDVTELLQRFVRHGPEVRYRQLHEVRASVEVEVAGLAAERIDDAALTALHDLCDQLPGHADDIVEASRNDYAFHRGLALATGNDFFVMLHDVLGEALMQTRVATFSFDPRRIVVVARAHTDVVRALEAHRAVGARQAMADHLDEVLATWVRYDQSASSEGD